MLSDAEKRRLRWGCRRGMLELDVILEPFFEQYFSDLDEHQQKVFIELLACQDPELFAWFMGHEQCPDPELAKMVQLILDKIYAKIK